MKTSEMNFFDHHKDAFWGGAVISAIHQYASNPSAYFLYGETFHTWLLGVAIKSVEVIIYGAIGGIVGMIIKRYFNKWAEIIEKHINRYKK